MPDAGMKVIIDGDASGSVSASAKTNAALDKVRAKAKQAQLSMEQLQAAFAKNPSLIANNKQLYDSLAGSISSTGNALEGLYKGSITANYAGLQLSRVLRESQYFAQSTNSGILMLAHGIPRLGNAFQQVVAETGSTSAAFSALGSALLGPVGVAVAVSAVTTIIANFLPKLLNMKSAADEAAEALSKIKTPEQITTQAVGSQQGQIAEINALVSAIQDHTKSLEERNNALSHLKEIDKDIPKDFDLQRDSLDKLTASVEQFKKAIIAEAVVKGFTDEISKLGPKILEATNKFIAARDNLNRITSQQATIGRALGPGANPAAQAAAAIKPAQDAFNAAEKALQALRQRQGDLSNGIDSAIDEWNKYKDASGDATGKSAKSVKTVSDILQDLQKQLSDNQKEADLLGQSYEVLAKEDLQAVNKAISDLIALGLDPADERFRGLIEQVNKFSDALNRIKYPVDTFIQNQNANSQFSSALFNADTGNNLPAAQNSISTGLENPIPQGVSKNITDFNNDATKQTQQSLNELTRSAERFGRALGDAFASGFDALLHGQNLLTVTQQLVERLIEQLIAAAVEAAVVAALTGGTSAAGGAAGSFSNLFAKFLHFGTGGYVAGPTVAVIGDRPGGEFVLGQDQLRAIAGSAQGPMIARLDINGRALQLFIERSDKFSNSVN